MISGGGIHNLQIFFPLYLNMVENLRFQRTDLCFFNYLSFK